MSDFEVLLQASLDTKEAKSEFDRFKSSIGKDIIKVKLDADFVGSNSDFLKNIQKQFQTAGQQASQSLTKGFNLSKSPTIKEFTDYKKALQKQTTEVSKIMESTYGVSTKDSNKWSGQYVNKNQQAYIRQLQEERKETEKTAEQLSKIHDGFLSGKYDAKSSSMTSKLSPYANQNTDLLKTAREQAKLYDDTLKQISDHFDSNNAFKLNDDEVVKSFDTMLNAAKKFENTMTQVRNVQSKDLGLGVAERSANSVKSYYEANSNAIKKYGAELKDLESRYRSIKTVAEKANLDSEFKNLKSQISAEGLTGKNLFEELGRGMKQIGQFAWTYSIIQQIPTAISRSMSELKQIDDILTEISKTSDLTTSQIKELGENSFDAASKYGKTASDYLIGVQEMSRSGFYGEQAEALAQLSILGQAAGDMTADVSNSYLLATNAAYQYQGSVEKLNTVLDGQNMITNRNSVSMNDMAQATSEAASMAAQTGVEIDQLSAMIGTMEAKTKSGGSEVGNAIKAILINLQNTSSDKIVDTLDKANASMTTYVNGVEKLRNPIEILKDLADTYNSLEESDPLKSEILTNIGQKYHANKLSALLTGWDDYEKMLIDYSQGGGSSSIEAEKSASNWSGSINKLSNAWTELIQNFANSGAIITITDMLTGLVNVIDDVISGLGGFKSLFSIIGGGFLSKNGFGKRNAALYKIKQNNRRFINVETSIA